MAFDEVNGIPTSVSQGQDVFSPWLQAMRPPTAGDPSTSQDTSTAAIVGGPPPAVVPTSPTGGVLPGLTSGAPMSSAQAGGPAARSQQQPLNYGNMPVGTGGDKTASIIATAVQGMGSAVRAHKQMQFEKEAASSSQVMTEIINSKLAQEKMKSGQQLTPDDIKQMAAAMGNSDPKKQAKIMKLMEKAQSDPMSGAYIGIQRAYQGAMANYEQKQKMQNEQTKAQAEAAQKDALAEYTRTMKGQNEQARIKELADAAREKADAEGAKTAVAKQAATDKILAASALKQFKVPELTAEGSVARAEDGTMQFRDMTMQDIQGNPERMQQYQERKVKIQKMIDNSRATQVRAAAAKLSLEASMLKAQKYQPGGGQGGAVIQRAQFTAGIAADYLTQMKDIATKHPEFFGPSGLFGTKLEQYAGDGDVDAMEYIKLAQAASIPIMGTHLMRSAKKATDVEHMLLNQWQDPKSAIDGIDTYLKTSNEIVAGKFNPNTSRSTAQPTASPSSSGTSNSPTSDDPFKQFGGKSVGK